VNLARAREATFGCCLRDRRPADADLSDQAARSPAGIALRSAGWPRWAEVRRSKAACALTLPRTKRPSVSQVCRARACRPVGRTARRGSLRGHEAFEAGGGLNLIGVAALAPASTLITPSAQPDVARPARRGRRRRTRRLGDAPERRSGPARRGTAGPDRSGPVLVHSRIVEEALQRTCLCRRVGVLGLSVRCRLPRPERRGHPDPGWQTISTAQPLSLTGDGAKQMKKVVALYFDAKLNQMLIPSVWNPPGPLAANPYLEAPIVGTSSSTPSAGSTCAAPSPASRSPVRSRRRAGRSRHRTWCSRGRRLSSSWPRRSPRGQASGEPVGRAQPVKAGVASAPTAGLADTVTVADAVAENGTPGSV